MGKSHPTERRSRVAFAPCPALAEDVAAMTPVDLQSAAIAAVDAGESDALMLVMKEMQRRQMVFSAAVDRTDCEEVIPLPSTITDWKFSDTARLAYITAAKKRRLAEGSCTYLFKDYSFADFTLEALGKVPDAMTDGDRPALTAIENADQARTEALYRDHEIKICRANCAMAAIADILGQVPAPGRRGRALLLRPRQGQAGSVSRIAESSAFIPGAVCGSAAKPRSC